MDIKGAIDKIVRGKKGRKTKKGQSRLVTKPLFLACAAFLALLVCVSAAIFLNGSKVMDMGRDNAAGELAQRFKDCFVVQKNCPSETACSYFPLCGDGSYTTCRIYDCGDTYGVLTQDADGNAAARNEAKYNAKVVQAKKNACGKSMRIVEQNCQDGKMQIMVKLSPVGDCKIGEFSVLYENAEPVPNRFTALEGGNYLVTADTCGKLTGVVPRTVEGIAIF